MSYTTSGATALRVARERPDVWRAKLAIVWALHCVHTANVSNFTDMARKAIHIAHADEFAVKGDRVMITAGMLFGTPGATKVLRIGWSQR